MILSNWFRLDFYCEENLFYTPQSHPMFISSPPPISALCLNLVWLTSFLPSLTLLQLNQSNILNPLDSCIFMQLSSLFPLFRYIHPSSHSSKRLTKLHWSQMLDAQRQNTTTPKGSRQASRYWFPRQHLRHLCPE